MKALSVRAPWAELIASGVKTIEVRSRPCAYRGELLICQSGGGTAIAIVDVVDCVPFLAEHDTASAGVWSIMVDTHTGHWAWMLRLVRRVTSPVIKGRLSFYDVDSTLVQPLD